MYSTTLRAPNQKSSGKKIDSDPDSSSTTACVWWRNPQPSADSKQGESAHRREKEGERDENLSQNRMNEKGHPTPPYIGQGGGKLPSTSHVGLIPRGGGKCALGGHGPLPWRLGPRGRLPLFLMGLFRPICLFFLY